MDSLRSQMLGLVMALGAAAAADAATLATPIRFSAGDMSVSCRLNNVGTKPITIRAARILGNSPGAGTLGLDSCSDTALAPESTCVFVGTTESGHIGAAVEVKGSGKTLRGLCSVSSDGVVVHYFEMR